MYLAIMMLTGQGQPDGVLPWYTKLIVVVTAIFSVAQFAIPASMLTWGFEAEASRRIRVQVKNKKKMAERHKLGMEDPVSSCSSDGYHSDESWQEYEEEIVGSE